MKKIIIFGLSLLICTTIYSQDSWFVKANGEDRLVRDPKETEILPLKTLQFAINLIDLSSPKGPIRLIHSDVTKITVIGKIYMDESESGSALKSVDAAQRFITICGKENALSSEKAIITTRSGRVLSIESNSGTSLKSKFKFENIEISGGILTEGRETGGGILISRADVILGKGAIVTNNKAAQGGGIGLMLFSTLTIDGGIITNNSINENDLGGGIRVFAGSVVMNDGVISNNSGNGITINEHGSFEMNGGSVKNNYMQSRDSTGVTSFGKFTMTGGTISGNGTGVIIHGGSFIMENWVIENNTSTGSAGGVAISEGNFTMKNGTIRNNSTAVIKGRSFLGGGVLVIGGEFIMQGGIISGNYAIGAGGGIAIINNGKFSLVNGRITNNRSEGSGGGVVVSEGLFNMTGGEITGNNDAKAGGGISVINGTFTRNGGNVNGNNAPLFPNIYQQN